MKKLFFELVAVAAFSFASCDGNKTAATEAVDSVEAVVDSAAEVVDSAAAVVDSAAAAVEEVAEEVPAE